MQYRLLRVLLLRALGGGDTGIPCVWYAAKDSLHNLPRDPQAIDRPSCPQKQIPLPTIMKASSVSVLAATLLISIDLTFATECTSTQLVDVTSATLEVSMDDNCVKVKAMSGSMCSSTECAALIKDLAAKLPDCTVGGKSIQTMYKEGVPDCDKTTATSAGPMVKNGMMISAAVAAVSLVYITVVVGGGVVGDLSGHVTVIDLRSFRSRRRCVASSIGGIDAEKNLLGVFHMPIVKKHTTERTHLIGGQQLAD